MFVKHLHWLILRANFFPLFAAEMKKRSWKQIYVFNVFKTNMALQNLIFFFVYGRFVTEPLKIETDFVSWSFHSK